MKDCNFLIIFRKFFLKNFICTCIVFLWYLVEPGHLPHEQEANHWQPCVLAIYDFASVFLFSVETQHTVMNQNF